MPIKSSDAQSIASEGRAARSELPRLRRARPGLQRPAQRRVRLELHLHQRGTGRRRSDGRRREEPRKLASASRRGVGFHSGGTSIFTRDTHRANRVVTGLHSTTCWINASDAPSTEGLWDCTGTGISDIVTISLVCFDSPNQRLCTAADLMLAHRNGAEVVPKI